VVSGQRETTISNPQSLIPNPSTASPHPNPLPKGEETAPASPRKVRLGIARDEAFHFYYADNLEAFEQAGTEWVHFSPISDSRLPADLDGLYFGGGYPEMYAARLAGNAAMLADVRQFAASGRAIYAECGGLMYLGESLAALDGVRYPLAGVLPIQTAMLSKLKSLGYSEVTLREDSLWGPRGTTFRGHEFHYSEFTEPFPDDSDWQRVYSVMQRSGEPVEFEGYQKGRILASYVHAHVASHPRLIESFMANCGGRR
jgi:cobyrinic acid a,c-diamide synthase